MSNQTVLVAVIFQNVLKFDEILYWDESVTHIILELRTE